jgi:hypothetical protein
MTLTSVSANERSKGIGGLVSVGTPATYQQLLLMMHLPQRRADSLMGYYASAPDPWSADEPSLVGAVAPFHQCGRELYR